MENEATQPVTMIAAHEQMLKMILGVLLAIVPAEMGKAIIHDLSRNDEKIVRDFAGMPTDVAVLQAMGADLQNHIDNLVDQARAIALAILKSERSQRPER